MREKNRETVENENEAGLNQPSESSLFLRTRRANGVMKKCARQHISEVVPLSLWSLKKNKALTPLSREKCSKELEEIRAELPEGSLC